MPAIKKRISLAELKVEIEKTRSEIQKSKVEIIKWMFAALTAQTAIIITMMKLMI